MVSFVLEAENYSAWKRFLLLILFSKAALKTLFDVGFGVPSRELVAC